MKWQEQTNRKYRGQVEEALFPAQTKRLLAGRTIVSVRDVEGRAGGANNDCVTIRLDDGSVVQINAYSGGNISVIVKKSA